MTFRDDHDAALARAEALERELAVAHQQGERDQAAARAAAMRIATLERELASLRKAKPTSRVEPPADVPHGPKPAASTVLFVGALLLGIGVPMIAGLYLGTRPRAAPAYDRVIRPEGPPAPDAALDRALHREDARAVDDDPFARAGSGRLDAGSDR